MQKYALVLKRSKARHGLWGRLLSPFDWARDLNVNRVSFLVVALLLLLLELVKNLANREKPG